MLTGVMKVVLGLWLCGRLKLITMERRAFCNQKSLLGELYSQGLSELDTSANTLSLMNYILETDKAAPTEYYHDKLGFYQLSSGETIFLADKLIGPSEIVSRYKGPVATAPKGPLEGWIAGIHELVNGHVNLELWLSL